MQEGAFYFILPVAREGSDWTDVVYLRYATLTTLGYGDITPKTELARALTTAEAVIGVLFTAVFMSRLVGLYARGVRFDGQHDDRSGGR